MRHINDTYIVPRETVVRLAIELSDMYESDQFHYTCTIRSVDRITVDHLDIDVTGDHCIITDIEGIDYLIRSKYIEIASKRLGVSETKCSHILGYANNKRDFYKPMLNRAPVIAYKHKYLDADCSRAVEVICRYTHHHFYPLNIKNVREFVEQNNKNQNTLNLPL